jgi:hypothetical protein
MISEYTIYTLHVTIYVSVRVYMYIYIIISITLISVNYKINLFCDRVSHTTDSMLKPMGLGGGRGRNWLSPINSV